MGGFLVSLLGGSRHQIGGPVGALIVLVAATVTQFGVNGMLLSTMMSRVVLLLIGALRLGTFIRYILSALLFLHRMAGSVEAANVELDDLDPATTSDRDVVVCRIGGAFFFGAAAAIGTVLDRLAERPRAYVLDLSAVAVLDSTAAATLDGFVRQARGRGAAVFIAGARPGITRVLPAHGISAPAVGVSATAAEAVASGRALPGPAPA